MLFLAYLEINNILFRWFRNIHSCDADGHRISFHFDVYQSERTLHRSHSTWGKGVSYVHFITDNLQRKGKSFNKYFHQKPPGVSLCLSFQRCQGNLSPEGLPFPQAEIWLQFNDDWVCQPDDNSKTKTKIKRLNVFVLTHTLNMKANITITSTTWAFFSLLLK